MRRTPCYVTCALDKPCDLLVSNRRIKTRDRTCFKFSPHPVVRTSHRLERWIWIQRLAPTEPSRRIEAPLDGFGERHLDPHLLCHTLLLLDAHSGLA
ncbi:MAG: hypothetical protein RLZZ396_1945 [Planctomycetota bacterium]|jgi:hypothetical protein